MVNIYQRLLLAKVEVTKGIEAVPTAALNAIKAVSTSVAHVPRIIERPIVKQTMGNAEQIAGGDESTTIEIVCELKGSGVAANPPEISPLLQACRMVETIGVDVQYDPSSVTEKSATIYYYKDGMLWKMIGAVGTYSIEASIAAAPTITFSMSSTHTAPAAVAVPAGAVYQATKPVDVSTADIISDGATIAVTSFAVDAGNDVQEHQTTGSHAYSVANRAPTLTLTKDSINLPAEWAAVTGGTNAVLSFKHNAVLGNIVWVDAPNGLRNSVGYGERAEIDTLDVAYNLFESVGGSDDQIKLTFK
jgi:hypothetical protein